MVLAEFERGFAAGQAQSTIAQLNAYGVQSWLPEVEGPVDLGEPEHRAVLSMLGHQSQREVLRNRFRTAAAMAAQVRAQGRHLGGRPPYGCRLVDAGPHPNKVHAQWGRRWHRLDIDTVTAPCVALAPLRCMTRFLNRRTKGSRWRHRASGPRVP
ncbi:recombinase [Actinoplanes sp. SE50]|nr:recombinase [Actinoplanes sp. SE50/110]ATO81537.1 recombinase [Actinoplanes sp. SE50]SLL98944.1 recombinase [Actinoplanes sp. SE50/110]